MSAISPPVSHSARFAIAHYRSGETVTGSTGRSWLVGPKRGPLRRDEERREVYAGCAHDPKVMNLAALGPRIAGFVVCLNAIFVEPLDST